MKFTLKQARNYAELSQAEMAKRLHVGLNTYRNYENGSSPMRIKTAEMFANCTGVPFDQIIFYSETTDRMQKGGGAMKDEQNKKSQSVKIVTSRSHGVHIEDEKGS